MASPQLGAQEVLDTYVNANLAFGAVRTATGFEFNGNFDPQERADLPTSGTATYAGASRIDITQGGTLVSEADFVADFASNTVNGTLSNFHDVEFSNFVVSSSQRVDGALTIQNALISTTSNGEARIDGRVGGTLSGTGSDSGTTAVFDGAFVGAFSEGGTRPGLSASINGNVDVTSATNQGVVAFNGFIDAIQN